MKEQDSTKMEFLLTLNDNIVVQRYFNVRGYNPNAKNSIEFYDLINEIKDDLQYHLKMKTVIYMTDNSDSIMHDPSVMDTSYTDGPEIFNIFVKNGDTTICHRILDAKLFPPKIRYTVDIRQQVKSVLKDLTDIFSDEKFVTSYMTYSLI